MVDEDILRLVARQNVSLGVFTGPATTQELAGLRVFWSGVAWETGSSSVVDGSRGDRRCPSSPTQTQASLVTEPDREPDRDPDPEPEPSPPP